MMRLKESIPEWADEKLSLELPIIRSRGKGQGLEYLKSFPENVSDVAKYIAAFASSNTGMILLGVNDKGDLIGLKGLKSQRARDMLLQRIEGICRGSVKPSITPAVTFAVENKKIALVLSIPKGLQPVYYCNNIPYIRDNIHSRPAKPFEVIQLIQSWLTGSVEGIQGETPDEHNFLFILAHVLTNVIIFGEEIENRNINPWLDLLRAVFANCENDLHLLASKDYATKLNLADDLEDLAAQAAIVRSYRHYLGKSTWRKFVKLVKSASDQAKKIKKERIDVITLPQELVETAMITVKDCNDSLISLANRAEEIVEAGQVDQVQKDASGIGLKLLQLSQFGLDRLDPISLNSLGEIGTDLHLVETLRTYSDGGKSIRQILKKLYTNSEKLQSLTEGLQP